MAERARDGGRVVGGVVGGDVPAIGAARGRPGIRARRLACLGCASLVLAGLVVGVTPTRTRAPQTTPSQLRVGASGPEAAPAPAASRSPGSHRISAYFVLPATTVGANVEILRGMDADAITFGYRVVPASKDDYPAVVQDAIGDRRVFWYNGAGDWDPSALEPADRVVRDGAIVWTVMGMSDGSVVVSRSSDGEQLDPVRALDTAANRLGARTFVGLPAPKAGSADGTAWLPDTSYTSTMAEFTDRFVRDARAQGADGFYQSVEMPVTDTSAWDPVRRLYALQNLVVGRNDPGATVFVSPYLESRYGRASFTPDQAGRGARMLLDTANGTNLVIAPQDGLGVGTTALAMDRAPGRVAPLEQYLKAMRQEVGSHLWSNVELMRPGPAGARGVTTRIRVSQQLWTQSRYTSGAIAFIWDDGSRGIGAKRVTGGISEFSAGFGHTPD